MPQFIVPSGLSGIRTLNGMLPQMRSFTEPGSPESAEADCWLGDRPPRNRSPNIAVWAELRADVELFEPDRNPSLTNTGGRWPLFNGINACSITRTAFAKVVTITANHSSWRRFAGLLRHRGKMRHRKKMLMGTRCSCDVLIHQTQDQGIEAVGPGAGRDDYDQHKSIKRLR